MRYPRLLAAQPSAYEQATTEAVGEYGPYGHQPVKETPSLHSKNYHSTGEVAIVTTDTLNPTIKPFRELKLEDDGKYSLTLNFHSGQTRAWQSDARWVFYMGGTQVGKTCFGPHWLLREIERKGPGDYLAITATFPLLKLKMLPEFLYVFESIGHLGTYKDSDKVFIFHKKDGDLQPTRVIFGSATNPESIESATAKAAWLDEVGQQQFKREAWEAVLRRLSLAQGRILGTTTLYGLGWLKNEVYDPWATGTQEFRRDVIDIIQVDSKANPAFPIEEYERAKRTLPRWKFRLFYQGQYDKPAGLIYDSFDELTCKIKRFTIPSNWLCYVGHDFGPNNTAAVWYAQDPGTGYLYVYREYLEGGLSAFDHAQKFKQMSETETIIKRVGGSATEDGWRESFTSAGWPIQKPRMREVEAGINRVYGWHQQNKLFVFDDLAGYLDEKTSYSRKLDENYEPTELIDQKSKFHKMDAERYLLSDFQPESVDGSQTNIIHRFTKSEGFSTQPSGQGQGRW
jgi:hypothetical protein